MGRHRHRRRARVLVAAALVAGAVLVPTTAVSAAEPPALPALPVLPTLDPASASLSPGGRAMLEAASLEAAPRYALSATVDPETGDLDGRMHARVARPDDGTAEFRMLAGLPALHTGLEVRNVTVDGKTARAERDRALLRVAVPHEGGPDADVKMRFSYRVPRAGTTTGRPLTQATIALLSLHREVSLFGHWFPVWLPAGAEEDPALSGFGDIGNFAAGAITARVRVPAGYDVVTGGINVGRRKSGGWSTATETAVGVRDLSLAVGRDLRQGKARAGDVTVRATAAATVDIDLMARTAASDLGALAELYGPYPWSELDVVGVMLGPDAGGMEWPGVVWISGLERGPTGDPLALHHELAHQWWHALVGNDSIREPAVDEALAQYSTCLISGVGCAVFAGTARLECADRPTTEFASASEYGELVYRQAPGFYLALADAVGRDATVGALRGVVARHAFGIITAAEIRDELAAAFPERADTVRALWDRYIGPPGCGQ